MKRLLIFGFILLNSSLVFSQLSSDSALYFSKGKLLPIFDIVFHENNELIYEKYNYFKGVYWLLERDTLNTFNNKQIVSKFDTIYLNKNVIYRNFGKKSDKKEYFIKIKVCDTLINKVRCNSYRVKQSFNFDDTVRQLIGWDNEEMRDFLNNDNSSGVYQPKIKTICFNNYKPHIDSLHQIRLAKLNEIYQNKIKRRDYIKQGVKLDTSFILKFIKDFGYCDVDKQAFNYLILNHCDEFLQTPIGDDTFFLLTLRLDRFPKDVDVPKMKQVLKDSKIDSRKKRKLIRKIKA